MITLLIEILLTILVLGCLFVSCAVLMPGRRR